MTENVTILIGVGLQLVVTVGAIIGIYIRMQDRLARVETKVDLLYQLLIDGKRK